MRTQNELLALAMTYAANRELLEILTRPGDDRTVGRRTLLVAHLLDKKLTGSQKDLAKRMNLSPARLSQMLRTFTSKH